MYENVKMYNMEIYKCTCRKKNVKNVRQYVKKVNIHIVEGFDTHCRF